MRTRAALMVVALLASACASDEPSTERRNAPMPLPRTEVAGSEWTGGRIIVVGGLAADGTASARADVYSPNRNRWSRLPDLPIALHHATVTSLDDRAYVVGGYTIEGAAWKESARVFSLGDGENSWRTERNLPAPRGAHAAAELGGRIVIAGGVSEGQVAATTVVFNPASGWTAGPSLTKPREHLAATSAGGRVYVIAGRQEGQNFVDVESWDGQAPAFWNEASLNDSRGGIGAATVDGQPCVTGGEEAAGTIASIECLRGGKWRRVAELESPRHGLAVVAVGSRLHVIGGGPQPGLTVSGDHEVFDL